MESLPTLIPVFFLTAALYAMGGFGGGSTYLAILMLAGFSHQQTPQVALLCNLVVVTGACWLHVREKTLSLGKLLPFLLSSIPMAYLGGRVAIGRSLFTLLLAVSLFLAGTRLWWAAKSSQVKKEISQKQVWLWGLPLGAVLGGVAGLVGIGGGIYLAPVLFLLGWGTARQIAAWSSFFILVNSLAGLAGQLSKGASFPNAPWLFVLLLAVFLGGQLGSRLSLKVLPPWVLSRITAVLVLWVSLRLSMGLL